MYRFLASPRWLGLAAATLVIAAVMVGLGWWQLQRYQERSAINDRIDAAAVAQPSPLASVLPAPKVGAGAAPPATTAWSRITATGVYDTQREVLARGRTVDGRVGYEVITPLVLSGGSAILVDRGWIPPAPQGMTVRPAVPPAPSGPVTVVGRIHLSESGARAVEASRQVRRIGVPQIASGLPYPVYGVYVLAEPVESGFAQVPVPHENAWQNAGYVVQWWLLAAMTLFGYAYLARREARGVSGSGYPRPAELAGAGYGRPHERAGDRAGR